MDHLSCQLPTPLRSQSTAVHKSKQTTYSCTFAVSGGLCMARGTCGRFPGGLLVLVFAYVSICLDITAVIVWFGQARCPN